MEIVRLPYLKLVCATTVFVRLDEKMYVVCNDQEISNEYFNYDSSHCRPAEVYINIEITGSLL